jgi:ribosome-binding ATPase YchF (GTP1/OBG family)
MCAQIEMVIAGLTHGPRRLPRRSRLDRAGAHRFIQAAYGLLDLISFLTSGEDEVRAWPICRQHPAVRAAGKIHSDTSAAHPRRGRRLRRLRPPRLDAKCREAGKLRLKGRDYSSPTGTSFTSGLV